MLREYALTPHVFSPTSFPSDAIRRLALRQLYSELIAGAGVVRNLADGRWETASESESANDLISLRLLKALRDRGIVKLTKPIAEKLIRTEVEWIDIARAEHALRPIRGVIRSPASSCTDELVADITELEECSWWNEHVTSWAVERSIRSYRRFFEPLFYYSREIMFVDRYLDPSEAHYTEFCELLRFLHSKNSSCHVWIHRPMQKLDNAMRCREIAVNEWIERFQLLADKSGHPFNLALRGKYAYRDQSFTSHERFVISNRFVLSLTNGFDTEKNSTSTASLVDRPDVRRFYERRYGVDLQVEHIVPR